jgi:hypothetical protein
MKRKGKIALGILVGVLIVFGAGGIWVYATFFAPAPAGPAITEDWVDAQLQDWAQTPSSRILFGTRLGSISYSNVMQTNTTMDVVDAEVNGSLDLNADVVRIDLDYDAFLQNNTAAIAKYDSAIQQIRASGKLVMIADSAAESYRTSRPSWANFVADWETRVAFLSARYKPDYYVVIKEPGWYYPMISYTDWVLAQVVTSATPWIQLADILAQIVKTNSPQTKVGVSVPADSLYHQKGSQTTMKDFFIGCAQLTDIDFLGFDIYDSNAFQDTQTFLQQYPKTGKESWILETWSDTTPDYNASRSPLDVSFLQLMYELAVRFNMTGMIPFYTNFFFSYEAVPTDTVGLITFYNGRTATFTGYQQIIANA